MTVVLRLLILFIHNIWTCSGHNYFTVAPSRGDLVLENNTSYLYISLAPDGIESDEYLYPICGDSIRGDSRATSVISKQLGYASCKLLNPPVRESGKNLIIPSMFYGNGMYCHGDEYHILRCLNMTLTEACQYYVRVVCGSGDMLFDVDKNSHSGNKGYQGQVVLLPPLSPDFSKTINVLNASASIGIVAIKQEGKCQYWRYLKIDDNHQVSLSLANTICRQMGYTHADPSSILSRDDAEAIFNMSFSYWDEIIGHPVIPTSEINCGRKSQECLGCCVYKPYLDCPDDASLPSLHVQAMEDRKKLLVIRCSFYEDDGSTPLGGTRNLCAFKENGTSCDKDVPSYTAPNVSSLSPVVCYAVIGSSLAAFVALFAALIIMMLCCKYSNRCPCRIEYRRLNNEDPQWNQ